VKRKIFSSQQGALPLLILGIVLILAGIGLAGLYVWDRNRKANDAQDSTRNSKGVQKRDDPPNNQKEESQAWARITTQGKAFSMRAPDGWKIVSYPGDFLGAREIRYIPGTPATNDLKDTDYVGHTLRFRASISNLDDAGFGQQWESPQPGLQETVEDFSIGNLQGKRFKGAFTSDIKQTLYEYVFDVGHGKKLDIVYTVYHDQGDEDRIAIVEKAIKTVQLQ
jgi:hypothetical protein